jgi:hypothetical protein
MQTRPEFTALPDTGWNINVPHDVKRQYIFPEPSLIESIVIFSQAGGAFTLNITLDPRTPDAQDKPLFVAFNQSVASWLDVAKPKNKNLRSNYRFLIANDAEILLNIFKYLYEIGYLPKSCIDNLHLTLYQTSTILKEIEQAWDLLSRAETLGANLTPAVHGTHDSLYATCPSYAEKFNGLIEEAIHSNLKQFFIQRRKKEFINKQAFQFAFNAILKEEKIILIIALTGTANTMKTITSYSSQFFSDSNYNHADIAHEYLKTAAAFPLDNFINFLQAKPELNLNAHMVANNNTCRTCSKGATLATSVIISDTPLPAKIAMLKYLLTTCEITTSEWSRLENFAREFSGIRITALIKSLNPKNERYIFYGKIANGEISDAILTYLFQQFDTSRIDAGDNYYLEVHHYIQQANLTEQHLLHLLKADETLLTAMLFYYASKYILDNRMLDFLLKQHPEGMLHTNKRNESLVLNMFTGQPRIFILDILIKNDPRLSLPIGWERLFTYLKTNSTETDVETLEFIEAKHMETAKFYTSGTITHTVFGDKDDKTKVIQQTTLDYQAEEADLIPTFHY